MMYRPKPSLWFLELRLICCLIHGHNLITNPRGVEGSIETINSVVTHGSWSPVHTDTFGTHRHISLCSDGEIELLCRSAPHFFLGNYLFRMYEIHAQYNWMFLLHMLFFHIISIYGYGLTPARNKGMHGDYVQSITPPY
jgi:hypothetical protein